MFQPSAAALSLLLATLTLPGIASADGAPRTITVSAEGAVRTKPDMATVSIAIGRRAETPQEALAQVSAAMSPVIERLIAAGVSSSDIQTTMLALEADYEWTDGTEEFLGYMAGAQLTVTILDLDRLDGILGAVVAEGVNRILGVRFGLRDEATALDTARVAAVAAARDRAQLYAEAAGVDLGDLLTLNERQGETMDLAAYTGTRVVAVAPPDAAVETAAGEMISTVSVTLVYEIGAAD